MLVLSLDSTATTASVALSDGDRLLAGTILNIGNKHSTTLLPAVKFVMDQAGLTVNDVDLVAVVAGPGSFTGVRIGTAAAKGLLLGQNIPCVGVSSLDTMAEGLSFVDGIICPMINARRDRYFAAFFSACDGIVTRLTEDDTLTGDEIEKYLTDCGRSVYMIGDGVEVFENTHAVKKCIVPETLMYPFAYYGGVVAKRIYDAADDLTRIGFTADALRPIYLRQPQAERELEERNKSKEKTENA